MTWKTTKNIPARIEAILREFILDDTAATRIVHEWEDTAKLFLVMIGGVGTGKTLAGSELVFRTPGAKFITAHEFARVGRFDEHMPKLERCPVLVLDDLGVEYLDDKGYMASLLDSLFNARYSHGVRTVVTTNCRDLRTLYGPRIMDRIRETGSVKSTGTDSMRGEWQPTRLRSEVLEELPPEPEPELLTPERIEELSSRVSFLSDLKKTKPDPVDVPPKIPKVPARAEQPRGEKCELCNGGGLNFDRDGRSRPCNPCGGSGYVAA